MPADGSYTTADPRVLASLMRGMSLKDIADSYSAAQSNGGPVSARFSGASGGTSAVDASSLAKMLLSASAPVADGVSVSPSLFGMRDQSGQKQYEAVSPGVRLDVGPLNANVSKTYSEYSEPDYKESGRTINFGGGLTVPIGDASLSYRANMAPGERAMHSVDVNAPVMGGDLSAALDAGGPENALAALLRYRRQF